MAKLSHFLSNLIVFSEQAASVATAAHRFKVLPGKGLQIIPVAEKGAKAMAPDRDAAAQPASGSSAETALGALDRVPPASEGPSDARVAGQSSARGEPLSAVFEFFHGQISRLQTNIAAGNPPDAQVVDLLRNHLGNLETNFRLFRAEAEAVLKAVLERLDQAGLKDVVFVPQPDPAPTEPPVSQEPGRQEPDPAPTEPPVSQEPGRQEPDPAPTEPPVSQEPGRQEPDPAPTEPPVSQEPGRQEPRPDPVTPPAVPPADRPDPIPSEPPQTNTHLKAMAGRVATINLEVEPDALLRVVDHPEYGRVTVNPDNSLALVLSGETREDDLSFRIEVTHRNGKVELLDVEVDVTPGTQAAGWGLGNYYMLEVGADGNVIVEHGENHRKVHVSGSDTALSAADIAAREGVDISKVTAKFLTDRPEYGATPDMALDEATGLMLWTAITNKQATSNWLLFESGYSYSPNRVVARYADGESELHPLYISAYGNGAPPVITSGMKIMQNYAENVVFQGLDIVGVDALGGRNLMLDDIRVTGLDNINVQDFDGFTLRNSEILDVHREQSLSEGIWEPVINRISGVFVSNTDGLLIENVLADHSGWEAGYDTSLSLASGQPPSMYSHNFYLTANNLDVTFRDNISLRAAAEGAQIRSGGFVEDNTFIDNNSGIWVGAGDHSGQFGLGNYSLIQGNVVTSGAHKKAVKGQGALTQGFMLSGNTATMLDNIITHMANPNNAAEIGLKTVTHASLGNSEPLFYNDTIIFNWGKKANVNVGELDAEILKATTIQNFAALVTGKADATIADLAQHLRLHADDRIDGTLDADVILAYFRAAFGVDLAETEASSARFVPNELGEGMRWDNRLNWDTGVLPTDGQDIDLGNNKVHYSGTTTIGDLDLGSYGTLIVNSGRLNIAGDVRTEGQDATIAIDNAGQVWMNGYGDSDFLNLFVAGGRFANTGVFDGAVRMDVSDNGQVILATNGARFDLQSGSAITIQGDAVRVGFDGYSTGVAVLRLEAGSLLAFDAGENGRMGQIAEFYSGAFEGGSSVTSGVNLGSARLHLDVAGMALGSSQLLSADEIIGIFEAFDVVGLGTNRNATVIVDYTNDEVVLNLTAGSGQMTLQSIGDEDDFAGSNAALWAALTDGFGLSAPANPMDIGFTW